MPSARRLAPPAASQPFLSTPRQTQCITPLQFTSSLAHWARESPPLRDSWRLKTMQFGFQLTNG